MQFKNNKINSKKSEIRIVTGAFGLPEMIDGTVNRQLTKINAKINVFDCHE